MNSHRRMFFRIIWKAFARRFSRVLIASLAISMGSATLSGLGLVALTVPDRIAKELRAYGANLVVLPQGADLIGEQDAEKVVRLGGDAVLGCAGYRYGNLLYGQQPVPTMATVFSDAKTVRPYWSIDGEMPKSSEQILLGENLAKKFNLEAGELMGLKAASLSTTKTESGQATSEAKTRETKQLEIAGILRTGGPEDDLVVVATDTYAKLNSIEIGYNLVEYSIKGDTEELSHLADKIDKSLPQVDAQVVRRTTENESRVAQTLTSLIWMVSIIISALMLIAVSATLSSIVSQRAREIGLKKALGALSADVFRELIGEAILLGLFGGVLGVLLGILMADYISQQVFVTRVELNWAVIALTVVFSIVVSVAGSLLPARRIAKINPINVLGGE